MTNRLLLIAIFSFSTSSLAFDDDYFCATKISNYRDKSIYHEIYAPECKTMTEISEFFEGYSVFLSGLTLACVLAPEPMTKGAISVLATGATATTIISFISKKMPCEGKTEDDEKIEQAVCRMMGKEWFKSENGDNQCI